MSRPVVGNAVIAAAALPLLISCAIQAAEFEEPQSAASRDAVFRDEAHPRFYTRVTEIHGDGDRNVLAGPLVTDSVRVRPEIPLTVLSRSKTLSGGRGDVDKVSGEIDYRSRVVVDFDREWLDEFGIVGTIDVRGELISDEKSREVEVEGYARIGEARQPSPAYVRTNLGLRGAAEVFDLASDLLLAEADTALVTLHQDTSLTARLASAVHYQDSVAGIFLTHDWRDLKGVDSLIRRRDSSQFESKKIFRAARGEWADTSVRLAREFQRLIGLHKVAVITPLLTLGKPSNVSVMVTVAISDQQTLGQAIKDLTDRYEALSGRHLFPVDSSAQEGTPGIRADVFLSDFRHLKGILRLVKSTVQSSLYSPVGSTSGRITGSPLSYRGLFLAELREAQVMLPDIGARPGDILRLTVQLETSSPTRPDTAMAQPSDSGLTQRRSVTYLLRLREFGAKKAVSDATLLVYRLGRNPRDIDDEIEALRDSVATNQVSQSREVELGANFVPAAGVSLAWSFYPRSSGAIRWLHPGIGINVGFTTFGSQMVTATSIPEGDDGVPPARVEVSTTSNSRSLQVIAGPVVTLFDGALAASFGWNLNVPSDRKFLGVGFSFLNIADRLGL